MSHTDPVIVAESDILDKTANATGPSPGLHDDRYTIDDLRAQIAAQNTKFDTIQTWFEEYDAKLAALQVQPPEREIARLQFQVDGLKAKIADLELQLKDVKAGDVEPNEELGDIPETNKLPTPDQPIIQIQGQYWQNTTGYDRLKIKLYFWTEVDGLKQKHGHHGEFFIRLKRRNDRRALNRHHVKFAVLDPYHDAQLIGWGENEAGKQLRELTGLIDSDSHLIIQVHGQSYDMGVMEPRKNRSKSEPVGDFWYVVS